METETMYGFKVVYVPLTRAQYYNLMSMVYDHSRGDWENTARMLVKDKPEYVCVPKKDSAGNCSIRFLY